MKPDFDVTVSTVFLKAVAACHQYPEPDRTALACVLTVMAGAPMAVASDAVIDKAAGVPAIAAASLRRLADRLDPHMQPNADFRRRVAAMAEQFATLNTQG